LKVTDLPSLHLSPGHLIIWRACAPSLSDAIWAADSRRPSYLQEAHIAHALEAAGKDPPSPSWVGCTFDLPAELDRDAFVAALRNWINRHENLRSHITLSPRDGLRRHTLPTGAVNVEPSAGKNFTDGHALARYLEALFDREASPLHWPAYVFATVSHADATTVFIATDHILTDGYSTLRSAYEIHTLYACALTAQDRGHTPPSVSAGTSYPDFAEAERSAAEALTAEDESIVRWRRFVADAGGRLPAFPLPVGDMSRNPADQPGGYLELLDAPAAQAFDRVCRQAGGDSFSGLLACLAKVGYEVAGAQVFRTMSPFNTCADPLRSIGWYVGMGPIAFRLKGTDSFTEVLHAAVSGLEGVKALACIPIPRVEQLLGQPLSDPFMVSYSDFRRTAGARHWNTWRAVILRSRSNAPDDVYFWIFRTHDGLSVSYRHPATGQAHIAVPYYMARTKQLMAAVASNARWPTTEPIAQESTARDGHQAHRSSVA
jgi:hypothetical protein